MNLQIFFPTERGMSLILAEINKLSYATPGKGLLGQVGESNLKPHCVSL